MSLLGTLYYRTFRYSGLGALLRATRRGTSILCYHDVVASEEDAAWGVPGLHLPVAEFEAQMTWLARHYRVVSLPDLVASLARGEVLRRAAVVTFDDAYEGVLRHALPVTRKLGIPITLFVVGDAPGGEPFWWDRPHVVAAADEARHEKWLTECQGSAEAIFADVGPGARDLDGLPSSHFPASWSELGEAVAEGTVTIGAHTLSHRSLPTLSEEALRLELVEGADRIEEALGQRPALFAYPYGAWSPQVREAVRRAGYEAAVVLDEGLNVPGVDPMALRRVNISAGLSGEAFEVWVQGLRP